MEVLPASWHVMSAGDVGASGGGGFSSSCRRAGNRRRGDFGPVFSATVARESEGSWLWVLDAPANGPQVLNEEFSECERFVIRPLRWLKF